MKDIIFLKAKHYQSYTDYWKLIELSGFKVIPIECVDWKKKATYILSPVNGECANFEVPKKRKASIILWDLERPAGRGGLGSTLNYLNLFGVDEIWHSNKYLSVQLNTKYVRFGSDTKLVKNAKVINKKKYDFVHVSHINKRRQIILSQLDHLKIASNGWGKKRHKKLLQSLFGLNLHQDEDDYGEPLRLALFAAYKLPVISEIVYDDYISNKEGLLYLEFDNFASGVNHCIANYDRYKHLGNDLYQVLCKDYQFGKVVRETVG